MPTWKKQENEELLKKYKPEILITFDTRYLEAMKEIYDQSTNNILKAIVENITDNIREASLTKPLSKEERRNQDFFEQEFRQLESFSNNLWLILTISPSLCVKSSSDLSPDSKVIEGLIVTGGIAITVKTIHSGLTKPGFNPNI